MSMKPPLPGERLASMNRMSPPTGVPGQAGRDPGHAGAHRHLVLETRRAEDGDELVESDPDMAGAAIGDLDRGVAQHTADLALQGCARRPRGYSRG